MDDDVTNEKNYKSILGELRNPFGRKTPWSKFARYTWRGKNKLCEMRSAGQKNGQLFKEI